MAHPHATRLSLALAVACTLPLGGCLVTSNTNVDETGMRVSESTMTQVQPGQTTGEWLRATLGEPTLRSPVEGDPSLEIWRYEHVRTESSAGAVFLIFGGRNRRTESTRVFFELRDNVVQRTWREA